MVVSHMIEGNTFRADPPPKCVGHIPPSRSVMLNDTCGKLIQVTQLMRW
jgi:hypothetical protein